LKNALEAGRQSIHTAPRPDSQVSAAKKVFGFPIAAQLILDGMV